MKKILTFFLCFFLILSITSCKKEVKVEPDKKEEVIEFSERKQNIINLAKEQMIKQDIIIEEYLETFEVTKVYINGYYKKDGIKDIEIDFTYSCNTDVNCVKGLNADPKKDNTVWVQMNEEETKIEGVSVGISINANDINNGNYIRIGEIIE